MTGIREDFLESLEDLTSNSRAIIKTLTEIAEENENSAPAIADALCTHIMECNAQYKLPALYLLDSICKTLTSKYADLFAARIPDLIKAAFAVSPDHVKVKINDLFKTWAIGQPSTGLPIFPHEILKQVNEFMMMQNPQSVSRPMSNLPPAKPRLTQSTLMVDLNRFRNILEADEDSLFKEKQLSILSRLESTISGVVDPKILPEILEELEFMKYNREQNAARKFDKPRKRKLNRNNNAPNNRGESKKGFVDSRRPMHPNKRTASGSQNDTMAQPTPNINPLNGFPGLEQFSEMVSQQLDVAKLAQQTFQATNFSSDLDLATACDTDVDIKLIGLLYDEGLPLQCSSCGFRFKDSVEGRQAEDNEMDWHFKANKDIRENHSRNRCWFLTKANWINYKDEDEVYNNGKTDNETQATDEPAEEEDGLSEKDLEALRKKCVEIPSESSGVCPVCQEPYETSWSEESETWVWTNAVEINGHYVHATCSADPRNKKIVESLK